MGTCERCAEIASQLESSFELVDLGPVKYLLGVQVMINQSNNCVFFRQTSYIDEIFRRFTMMNCYGISTPEALATEVEEEDISNTSMSRHPP